MKRHLYENIDAVVFERENPTYKDLENMLFAVCLKSQVSNPISTPCN